MLPTMPPPMSSGMRMVVMRKALVRMRSRYSRLAMSQTLCMGFAPAMARFEVDGGRRSQCLDAFATDLFDEDLFEGGLHDLEAGDAGAGADGIGEQRLGVGAWCCRASAELDLGVAGVVASTDSTEGWWRKRVRALEDDAGRGCAGSGI